MREGANGDRMRTGKYQKKGKMENLCERQGTDVMWNRVSKNKKHSLLCCSSTCQSDVTAHVQGPPSLRSASEVQLVFPILGGFKCYFKLFIIWRRGADTDPWALRPLFVPHPGCRARNSSAFSLVWVWGLQPWEWGGEFPRMRTSRSITDEWFAKPGLIPLHFNLI